VLLTAGPTFEALDPVRGLTNLKLRQDGIRPGAGLHGDAGAEVTLVAGPT
jgi:phosphopantothenoylcysteine synthetase/decarboxylase